MAEKRIPRGDAFGLYLRMANQGIDETGLNGPQNLHCGIGAGSDWQQVILKGLGLEFSPANGRRIAKEWDKWDAEHGFDFRVLVGVATNGDRDRLLAGDEPRPGAPPPPYLEFLA
jgi:hypothetical protein